MKSAFLLFLLFCFVNLTAQVNFSYGPKLNISRVGAGGVKLDDGRCLVIGGHGTNFVKLASGEYYSYSTNTFTNVNFLDSRDFSGYVKTSSGSIMLFGGMSYDLGVGQLPTTELFNPATNISTPLANMTNARTMATGAILPNGKVLIAGCWYSPTAAGCGDLYDPSNNSFTTTGNLIIPRACPLIFPMNDNTALIAGGWGTYGGAVYEPVEVYNLTSNTFEVHSNTYVYNDTGWIPVYRAPFNADAYRIKDGRFMTLAYKVISDTVKYSLVTIDPNSKKIELFNTTPSLPISYPASPDSAFPYELLIDSSKNIGYIVNYKANPYGYAILNSGLVNITKHTYVGSSETFTPNYLCWDTPKFLIGSNKILIAGGSVSNNFDPVDSSIIIEVNIPTSIKENNVSIKEYSLSQNYPNPFNPSTIIKYSLPNEQEVSLKIYNLLGSEVKVLVSGIQKAGEHQVLFNASGLASGVYIYTLKTSNFNQTKKLILLK